MDHEVINLTTQRRRLQDRIDKYSIRAAQTWTHNTEQLPSSDQDDEMELNDLLSDDSNDDSDNPFVTRRTRNSWSPENAFLLLPSLLGVDVCDELGFGPSVLKEKHMRIGQANDALQGLHMALSRKAILFRGLRMATSKAKCN